MIARTDKKLRRSRVAAHIRRHWIIYLMLLPMIVYFLIFSYYPMLGLQIAFKDWRIRGGIWGSPWATTDGSLDLFKNFKLLFNSAEYEFWPKFRNTVVIASLRLVCGFPVPILLALLLNEVRVQTFKKAVQTVSYLPHFISWVIISGILFSMTASGSGFQRFLAKIFGHEIYFFSNGNTFIGMLIISDIWKNCGWGTIIYFAGLSGINSELYEAAAIDGAGRWKRMVHVTLPGLASAITINLILQASSLVSGGFDQVYNLYNPAVYDKADIIETYLFRVGVTGGKYAVGTALGLFNSVIGLILTLGSNFLAKRLGGEGIW